MHDQFVLNIDISLECQKIPESSVDLTQNKGMVVDDVSYFLYNFFCFVFNVCS